MLLPFVKKVYHLPPSNYFRHYKPQEVKDEPEDLSVYGSFVFINKNCVHLYNGGCASVDVPVEENRDPLHGNNDRLAVWGLRVRVGGPTGRAGFLLA